VPLDHTVLKAAFEDRITPNGTAVPIFKDDGDPTATPAVPQQPDGLSFSGTYKVVRDQDRCCCRTRHVCYVRDRCNAEAERAGCRRRRNSGRLPAGRAM
jgi:hypothetical protein